MEKINTENELRDAILKLERTQSAERKILKEQFQLAYESVKPINLIKSTFKEVSNSEILQENILNTTIVITVGYLSKKMFQGISHPPLRKLLGTVLMYAVTNAVAKNPEVAKSIAKEIYKFVTELKLKNVERTY